MTPHPATGRGANPAATLQGSRRYRLRKKKNWVASAREQGRRVCICQECMAVDSPTWVLAGINGVGGEGYFQIWLWQSYVEFLRTFLVAPQNRDCTPPIMSGSD